MLFFSGKTQETAFIGVMVWALRCILSLGFMAVLVGVYTSSVEEKALCSPAAVCLPMQNIGKVESSCAKSLLSSEIISDLFSGKFPALKAFGFL